MSSEVFEIEETEHVEIPQKGDAGSLLASLRAKREAIASERHLDLDIPGYDGQLVARYGPVAWEVIDKIAERVNRSNSPRADVHGAADLLIAACREILIRQNDELISLNHAIADFGDEPVTYSHRLDEVLGINAGSSREVVIQAFNNDLALVPHQATLLRWLQESDQEVDEDF